MRIACVLLLLAPAVAMSAQQHVTDSTQVIEGPQTPGLPHSADQAAIPGAPATDPAQLTNDTVLRMHTAGLSDELIIQTVNTQPGRYDTGADDLIALRQRGISNDVLAAMMARARHPLPKSAAPLRAQSSLAPAIVEISPVNEIGVYYKDNRGAWVPMESEIVHIKSGGFVKSTLTHGIISKDLNGVVSGRESKLLLPRPEEFLIYTADGVEGTEYDLLQFRLNSKDREFRTLTGGVIHSTGGAKRDEVPFTPVKIAPHTYSFSIPRDLPGGEYGILPPGTGNATNGGKIYTFAVSE